MRTTAGGGSPASLTLARPAKVLLAKGWPNGKEPARAWLICEAGVPARESAVVD